MSTVIDLHEWRPSQAMPASTGPVPVCLGTFRPVTSGGRLVRRTGGWNPDLTWVNFDAVRCWRCGMTVGEATDTDNVGLRLDTEIDAVLSDLGWRTRQCSLSTAIGEHSIEIRWFCIDCIDAALDAISLTTHDTRWSTADFDRPWSDTLTAPSASRIRSHDV